MKTALYLLSMFAATAWAGESVSFCYNYGCGVEAPVRYDDRQLAFVRDQLRNSADAAEERQQLARALGSLYRWAGEQLPIHADKGGDIADDGIDGRMDCIDHATTTTRLLRMIEAHGWLRHHRVLEPARRSFIFTQHFTAVIEARAPAPVVARAATEDLDTCVGCYDEGGALMARPPSRPREPARIAPPVTRWAVDTWFRDNGAPAAVIDIDTWQGGAYPEDGARR